MQLKIKIKKKTDEALNMFSILLVVCLIILIVPLLLGLLLLPIIFGILYLITDVNLYFYAMLITSVMLFAWMLFSR